MKIQKLYEDCKRAITARRRLRSAKRKKRRENWTAFYHLQKQKIEDRWKIKSKTKRLGPKLVLLGILLILPIIGIIKIKSGSTLNLNLSWWQWIIAIAVTLLIVWFLTSTIRKMMKMGTNPTQIGGEPVTGSRPTEQRQATEDRSGAKTKAKGERPWWVGILKLALWLVLLLGTGGFILRWQENNRTEEIVRLKDQIRRSDEIKKLEIWKWSWELDPGKYTAYGNNRQVLNARMQRNDPGGLEYLTDYNHMGQMGVAYYRLKPTDDGRMVGRWSEEIPKHSEGTVWLRKDEGTRNWSGQKTKDGTVLTYLVKLKVEVSKPMK